MPKSKEQIVEEAVEADILRQDGSHFYVAEGEDEGEHAGHGYNQAYEWLLEEGYVVENTEPETEETDDPEPQEPDEETEDESFAREPEEAETSDRYDPDAVYRHAGDARLTFPREDRADAHIYPGQHLRDLPVDTNETLQGYIDEGLLRKIQ